MFTVFAATTLLLPIGYSWERSRNRSPGLSRVRAQQSVTQKELRKLIDVMAVSGARSIRDRGADVTVKDSKRYAATGGWGYYNFNHREPKAPTAKLKAKEECAFCHIAQAGKDEVCTQFYPLLDGGEK
jgi:hypothetical protein